MDSGRRIFVTYGNQDYYNSLERISKEAISTGRFHEVRVYTDKDLPVEIRRHELFTYSRGGGYWLWKPWVVLDVMKDMYEDDILVYSDAGSIIYNHREWDKWFKIMKNKSAIFFFYNEPMEKWTRRNILNYFDGVRNLRNFYQIMGGLFILKRCALYLIKEWYDVMFMNPEFVIDVKKNLKHLEYPNFIENRHDQSVLSGVLYNYLKDSNIKFLYQNCELRHPYGQAVFTARMSDTVQRNNTPMFPRSLEMIRKFFLVPLKYIKFKYLKFINSSL